MPEMETADAISSIKASKHSGERGKRKRDGLIALLRHQLEKKRRKMVGAARESRRRWLGSGGTRLPEEGEGPDRWGPLSVREREKREEKRGALTAVRSRSDGRD